MEWHEYKQAWRRRACAGSLGKAQAYTGFFALLLSPLGLWGKPFGDAMSWIPTLIFAAALGCLLAYGFLKAPHWLHRDVERERDDLREELTRADRIEGVLVELGGMRLRGVNLRNDLAKKDVLDKKDAEAIEEWHSMTKAKISEISPTQAGLMDALDLTHIVLPENIARHPLLVFHSERLSRLKDFIDKYDAMLMGSRGLGKREV